MNECSFLAFTIRGNKIRWTDKALADFKYRVGELTGRSWGVSMFCTVTARVAARRAVTSMVVAAASSLAAGSSPQRLDLGIPV